ncbi:MAG: P-II family nitrogen regulator [Fusobacteriaceae bacterium]|nr:P-II family nitrogen regulator [Fusobacteriaceae bacterium]
MKEVMAIIRMNMINKTKDALAEAGFGSLTCRKVFGRGKKAVNYEMIKEIMNQTEAQLASPQLAESISEGHRLIQKRLLTLIVNDDESDKVVDIIMKTNSTGNSGDGKIFVMSVEDSIRVRTGEKGIMAL